MNGVCLQKVFSLFIISTICVCGAGTMGSGIAQVAAQSAYTVILFDVNERSLLKAKIAIRNSLQKSAEKKKINEHEKEATMGRIHFTSHIIDCSADLIIDAIIENKAAKIDLFSQLSDINNDNTIFATNTSSLSVTDIASAVKYPFRVLGMHFFNPAPAMKLVEIVRGAQTDEGVIDTVISVVKQMHKLPVVCKDQPGFIVNRVARQYYLEAMKILETGFTDVENIDSIMEASGFKIGPFRLIDLIGMDINYSVSNMLWESSGKPERLVPSAIQKEKIMNGEFGRKTGKGFYKY